MHIRSFLMAMLVLLTACGPAVNSQEDATPSAPQSEDNRVHSMGACTVNLACSNGSSLTCSSPGGNCSSTTNSVTCDGSTQVCPGSGGDCTPAALGIVGPPKICYPTKYPFGRYFLTAEEPGVTYTWSASGSVVLEPITGDIIAVVRAVRAGWFTLYVTASRPGCATTTTFSSNFYAQRVEYAEPGACGP